MTRRRAADAAGSQMRFAELADEFAARETESRLVGALEGADDHAAIGAALKLLAVELARGRIEVARANAIRDLLRRRQQALERELAVAAAGAGPIEEEMLVLTPDEVELVKQHREALAATALVAADPGGV